MSTCIRSSQARFAQFPWANASAFSCGLSVRARVLYLYVIYCKVASSSTISSSNQDMSTGTRRWGFSGCPHLHLAHRGAEGHRTSFGRCAVGRLMA